MTNNENNEIIQNAINTELANREIEAAGHAATVALLAARAACDCYECHYANRHPQLNARRCWE